MSLVVAQSSAILSGDGVHRYLLTRVFAEGPAVLFVGLNPSTADEYEDDPTIRRMLGFARRWGYGKLLVANVYAYRATDPRKLRKVFEKERVGDHNDGHIREASDEAEMTIACWGTHVRGDEAGRARRDRVLRILAAGAPVYCLGVNRDRSPKHPLYLPGDTVPRPYRP